MNDVYTRFLEYIVAVWRRRWYVISIAWFFCGAGWTLVASLPDHYESSARIYVDMDTMLAPLMRGLAVETNLFQQVDIMQRTLLSRPNLEKVVLMTDMDLKVHTEEEKEALIERLKKRISLRQQGRNLFTVGYTDVDPEMTKRVVQAVLQIFVESNVGASRKDMDSTRRFIDDQIRDYEQQLNAAENRLAEFKRKHMDSLPGGENYYQRMDRMRAEVKASETQLAEALTKRDELRQQLAQIPQYIESGRNGAAGVGGAGPELDSTVVRILELQRTIDSLLTRYTPKHPDVLAAKKRLAQLKKQLAKEQKEAAAKGAQAGPAGAAGPSDMGQNMVPNPLYDQIKLQLVGQEATIASLKRRIEQGHADVEKWAKKAGLVPNVEAELIRLNRDYDIVKHNYEQLRARKESAKLARDLETKAQNVQFRIIDPPKVPLKPSGPNRSLFLSIVLLAGLGIGIGFAFLLGQINTTFANVSALRSKFTLPVLGSVTAIVAAKERRRRLRELTGFGLVSASLFLAFGGLQAIEQFGPQKLIDALKGLGVV